MKTFTKLIQQMRLFVVCTGIILFSFHHTNAQKCEIVNSSFEDGNTGFTSTYCYDPNGDSTLSSDWGCYVITDNALGYDANCGDWFMFVDGDNALPFPGPFWSVTVSFPCPGQYTFCFDAINLHSQSYIANSIDVNVTPTV